MKNKLALGLRLSRGVVHHWVVNCTAVLRQTGWLSWATAALRPFRVFLVLRTAMRLLGTKTYTCYGTTTLSSSLLPFVFSKHYARQKLSLSQRAIIALDHVTIEECTFESSYFECIYGGKAMELWQHSSSKEMIRIVLSLGSRIVPEGELQIRLLIGDEPLHTIGFSILNSRAPDREDLRVLFVSRMQARWRKDKHILDAFEAAFPQNSAAYFAYAALQGFARAINAHSIVGVRASEQLVFKERDPQHFRGAYDDFWQKLGGRDLGGLGFEIPVPFHVTPLTDVPSKHRKRSRMPARVKMVVASVMQPLAEYLGCEALSQRPCRALD